MRDHPNHDNERFGMIVAAAVAAVSIAAVVIFDFALGAGTQRSGPSMAGAAAIERAGASEIVTGALGQIRQSQQAENSRR
jgi:hypothetical protein